MNHTTLLLAALLLLTSLTPPAPATPTHAPADITAIIVPDTDPYYALIATSLACHYNATTNILLPLFVTHNRNLTDAAYRLLTTLLHGTPVLSLGDHVNHLNASNLLGTPATVSCTAARLLYTTAPTLLIAPTTNYTLALTATPLTSYLNCPLLLYDNNTPDLQTTIDHLHTHTTILIGNLTLPLHNTTITHLTTPDDIQTAILHNITTLFGHITYLTLTNPADATPPTITNTTITTTTTHIHAHQLILLGRSLTLSGNDTARIQFHVPDTLTNLAITATIPPPTDRFTPILSLKLYDTHGRLIAYSTNQADTYTQVFVKTLAIHDPGTYTLTLRLFHGLKGGYFSLRGFSFTNTDVNITIQQQNQSTPHDPLLPGLSMLAPYITAAHGGIIITTNHELTTSDYEQIANGTAAGPWYTPELIPYNNNAVNTTLQDLNHTLALLDSHGLLTGYLSGPAWLGILGDTTMIPMYYYEPSDTDIAERGLPSDNLYALNASLSTGRIIGWNVSDVSTLIVRTLFYQKVCGNPTTDWFHTFNFVFGEGFGETGGLFHQVPYSREIRRYNLTTHVYGDLRNSRQITDQLHVYTGANFVEYLGHGDWYWYTPSLYGMNTFGRAVDVAHASQWVYEKPSVFLTSACLMGRVDGIPPQQNIGLAMLHAGCNAFVGATRETGQEAELTIMENDLIVNDTSLGEALRMEKQSDFVPPTYFVRTLYGDPAFNPYEPLHGFSDQGRPQLIIR